MVKFIRNQTQLRRRIKTKEQLLIKTDKQTGMRNNTDRHARRTTSSHKVVTKTYKVTGTWFTQVLGPTDKDRRNAELISFKLMPE